MTDVRAAGRADHAWIVATARDRLGDEHQVHSRRQFGVLDGEVLLATVDDDPVGFLTWDHDAEVAEILALAVTLPRRGVGRALVEEVRARAAAAGTERIVVVTTDENVGAQAFYVATGFTLAETRVGAVDECRRRFKPTIPPRHPRRVGVHRGGRPAEPRGAPLMPEPTQYYWCRGHDRVERSDEACGMDRRIGPFDTAEQAEHWQDRVEQRNDEWDAADRAWEGDD